MFSESTAKWSTVVGTKGKLSVIHTSGSVIGLIVDVPFMGLHKRAKFVLDLYYLLYLL